MKQDFAFLTFLCVNLGSRSQVRKLYFHHTYYEKNRWLKSLEITSFFPPLLPCPSLILLCIYHLSRLKASFSIKGQWRWKRAGSGAVLQASLPTSARRPDGSGRKALQDGLQSKSGWRLGLWPPSLPLPPVGPSGRLWEVHVF